ncbi:MAG TPA: nickel pincer cofactor biosynthesis protein LarC [Bacteroidota bacterium]|nr:nickel pincer cofactor biosynthesis protein LarC [Bacteroidota bacterium]
MTVAYFDTIGGISGDMTLGALIQAGMPIEFLRTELSKLPLAGYSVNQRTIERSAIAAIKVDVDVEGEEKHSAPHSHEHDHHDHGHHAHEHEHHVHAHPSRSLKDILALIERSTLGKRVQERASKIFTVIGDAEAKIHNTTPEKVHFHEVGAVDSIVDIVGASIGLEYFGVEAVYSSPVKLGSGGFVETQHGKMPIPTPATVEILRDYPTQLTDIPSELTTPTGAGIIKALSSGLLSMEGLHIRSIGYGTGSRDIAQVPNLLRVFIGTIESAHHYDELVTVETNIDNMNPEIFPFVLERLLGNGAHDAFLIPVIMKKGRPGIVLSVLVNRGKLDEVLKIVFAETTTLGVRVQPVERRKVQRSARIVKTSFGEMKVKVIGVDGAERLSPEFEECKRIALEKNIPLVDVYKQVESELQ